MLGVIVRNFPLMALVIIPFLPRDDYLMMERNGIFVPRVMPTRRSLPEPRSFRGAFGTPKLGCAALGWVRSSPQYLNDSPMGGDRFPLGIWDWIFVYPFSLIFPFVWHQNPFLLRAFPESVTIGIVGYGS